jgi:hypothetical protein
MGQNNYVCHSGGCPGADMEWENQGNGYDIKTIAYSFPRHIQEGKNQNILTQEQLNEGWEQVLLCEKLIKRPLHKIKYNQYVKNLLCRNWFQVKNSEAIYAVGTLVIGSDKIVDGGTGWAIQMAVNSRKPIYLFEQNFEQWLIYHYPENKFVEINSIPTLTTNFAGIGTRKINDKGIQAISDILKFNLGGKNQTN